MPARLSSMELSSPDTDAHTRAATTPGNARRKSGRVTKKPETIYSSATAKRKRSDEDEARRSDVSDDEDDEDESDESSESEPDEEEVREKRRKKRLSAAKAKTPQKKPAAKKSKTNGETVSLAIRPAGKAKKPRKPRPSKIAAAEEVGGLYGDVFAGAESLNDVAALWVKRVKDNESAEMAELINFALRCAGCDSKVDMHDIEDPDSAANKLGDIQDEYQAQNVVEYPLIQKGKGTASFRHNLIEFFNSLIETLAETGMLYDTPIISENIAVWVSTMSSANNRPFRHTATVISMSIVSSLCQVGKKIVETNAKTIRQRELEATKKNKNKARVADLDAKIKEAGQRQESLDAIIKDWFDTVFVHRYRDIDPRIRVECVQGLSEWTMVYPDLFFDGHHLRYLGWVLSDVSAPTRLEVVKQLQKLFKDQNKLGGLKTFTERFRSRIVEMATQDAESNVRAASVELLDILREDGLLEPDDIDSVGRLIFDAEPRVRKAVVVFFGSNIEEMYESKIEELGGQETLEEALVTHEGDDDYESPRVEWLKLKCLVEMLQSYDEEDQALPSQIERGFAANSYVLVAAGIESRFSVAAEALYGKIPELKEWEVIAGYLLFDHSQITAGAQQNGTTDDPETALKQECKLNEREEIVLLDILNSAVKLRLTHTVEAGKDKKTKISKKEKEQLQEVQETAARHLAVLIPRLLNKFGAVPDAASAVLRLEHVLNLDVFQELRQDSTTYSALLDDIKKQFLSHGSEAVLVEASRALLHAKSYEELGEITDGKVQGLWEDTVTALHALKKGKGLMRRGNVSENVLSAISNTVLRISKLASISDCTEALEAPPPASASARKRSTGRSNAANADQAANAIAILTELIHRGVPNSDTDSSLIDLEDAVASNAARALLFYFMWKVRAWETSIASTGSVPDEDVEAVALRRDACVAALEEVLEKRQGADELRLAVAGTLLDLSTLFTTLRQAKARRDVKRAAAKNKANTNGGSMDIRDEPRDDFMALLLEIDSRTQKVLLQLLASAEKAFAKKSHRNVEVAEDDEPLDIDEDPESSDEEDEDADADEALRAQEMLFAEQRLCELASKLVLSIVAGVVDGGIAGGGGGGGGSDGEDGAGQKSDEPGPVRKRLERNKTRLGQNYKEVVAYLNAGAEKGAKKAGKGRAKSRGASAPPPHNKGKKSGKSKEIIRDESDEEDEGENEEQRLDEEEEVRRRELLVDEMEEDEGEGAEEGRGAEQAEEMESVLGD